ncbi:glutathione S-transferase family protein [Bradyrhizobium sp. LMG 9283]|uniref:glutathione S-transferase family protein n=1 Tax=Bradyrhizobium sp. LMG 9283 TaxID=592064 RepID=UPI00389107D8
MSLTLHFHPLSSFCWKVLIALYDTDVSFTPNPVDLGNPGEREAFLKLWPIGKFPVLVDAARGETVPESSIIIEYLDRHYPGRTHLIPTDPDLALRTRLCDRLYDLYVHMPMQQIVGDRLRPHDKKDPLGVEAARARIRSAYAMLDQRTGPYAMGEAFTLADCSALPALFYANNVEPIGADRSNISSYLERLKVRPSVVRVLREAEPYLGMFPKEG